MELFKRRKGKTAEEWRELGLNAKDPDEAVEYYTKCLELNPKDAEAWDSKGAALYALKRYEEATNCYDISLENAPNSEGTKLRKYKTKVEQWKREGYKVDDLEEMFK